MKSFASVLFAGALGLALTACNSSSKSVFTPGPGATTYKQIERLARPAVKEVFENFVDHQTTNAVEPYAGTAGGDPLQAAIKTFENTVRPPKASAGSDYGAALQSILYPDEYTVNLASADKASYLGVETGGATGGKFGGRDISDDVVDISLGAAFGKTLVALNVQPEDGQENTCLSTEHVAQNPSQAKTSTFPYLAAPH